MLRTLDGKPLDVLLNQLGLPSRVNAATPYELLLGKIAEKRGEPYRLPAYLPKGIKWHEFVEQELKKAGLNAEEEVFDPSTNKKLEQPITVGNGLILKLHHVASSKLSARGTGSYDANLQPTRGGGENAQSKRLSGLESQGLLSAGAYKTLKEGSTLRGQRSDDFWRQVRMGYKPGMPGQPFVWKKMHALMNGAGMIAKDKGNGRLRLGPMTDDDLDTHRPSELKNGELVDLATMEPVPGGLFDPAMVGNSKWGFIRLPFPVIQPSAYDTVRTLLGLTKKQLDALAAGHKDIESHEAN
jgi:hypothetical protein